MAKRPTNCEKLFYKIGEAAAVIGVKPHVLRYWESEFPMLRPAKTRGAHRVYRRRDVETAILIRRLLHSEGYTIPGARKRVRDLLREGNSQWSKHVAEAASGNAALPDIDEAAVTTEAAVASVVVPTSQMRQHLVDARSALNELLAKLREEPAQSGDLPAGGSLDEAGIEAPTTDTSHVFARPGRSAFTLDDDAERTA